MSTYTAHDVNRDLFTLDDELRRAQLSQEDRLAWLRYAHAGTPVVVTTDDDTRHRPLVA